MTIANPARLQAARRQIEAFRLAGVPPKGAAPDAARKLQLSPAGWPVTRGALVAQLVDRMGGVRQPMQANTSYCGPASFLYCLLEDRPDLYVAYATSIWTHGDYRIGDLEIDPDPGTAAALGGINVQRARNPKGGHISSLDWLMMASLSIATRQWFVPGSSAQADDVARSITYPWVLKRWFAAVGTRPVHDSMGLGLGKAGLREFVQAMHYWGRHWIVLQIDSSLIVGGTTSTFENRHWVVVDPHYRPRVRDGEGRVVPLGDIVERIVPRAMPRAGVYWDDSAVRDWRMDLRLFSWGKEGVRARTDRLGDVPARFYGAFAFPRFG
ncbi:hypothetical protein [uncultured Sphingomonas sp.]|uniref:hypothetical protein n=1 Tax=uncultured Sphingomonas sp. TaxID=158754 RepID=UPI0025DF57F2|nr:hypothetical protein [uncultured Sphingomonas sp.]